MAITTARVTTTTTVKMTTAITATTAKTTTASTGKMTTVREWEPGARERRWQQQRWRCRLEVEVSQREPGREGRILLSKIINFHCPFICNPVTRTHCVETSLEKYNFFVKITPIVNYQDAQQTLQNFLSPKWLWWCHKRCWKNGNCFGRSSGRFCQCYC